MVVVFGVDNLVYIVDIMVNVFGCKYFVFVFVFGKGVVDSVVDSVFGGVICDNDVGFVFVLCSCIRS